MHVFASGIEPCKPNGGPEERQVSTVGNVIVGVQ